MRDFNDVFISGRLGQNAEVRYLQSGTVLTSFSMAVSENYKKGNDWETITNWINVVLYGKEMKISKGEYVFVRGRIRMNKTDKATYFQIIASSVTTANDAAGLNRNSSGNAQESQESQQGRQSDSIAQKVDELFETKPVDTPDMSDNNLPEDDDSVPF